MKQYLNQDSSHLIIHCTETSKHNHPVKAHYAKSGDRQAPSGCNSHIRYGSGC